MSVLDFLDQEVLPRLTPDAVYSGVKWTETRGRYWRGPCPLHGGKDSNFSVDTVTLRWTCFSRCGSGSAVAFVNGGEMPHGRDYVEAVKKLAAVAGVKFPERERTEEELRKDGEKNRKADLLETFLSMAKAALTEDGGAEARQYLKGRGLSEDASRGLGLYTTAAAVRDALAAKGFTAAEVEASGLVLDKRWEGRLIIPWRDRWGYLGTFAARDLTGKVEEKDKYLYLKGTRKADLVAFGLDVALHKRPDRLVLVEGLLDVVNLQDRGLHNVAAIGGGGREFSPDRWERLAAFGVSRVVLVLDNDPKTDGTWPGLEGTLKALENVRKVHNVGNVPVVDVLHPAHLGQYKDPDALVTKEGADVFRALLDKREPAALFVARCILGDVTPESPAHERQDKAAAVAAFADSIQGDRSALTMEDLARLVSERTGYSPHALEDVADRHEERRSKEAQEKLLEDTLRAAAAARERGEDPVDVVRKLKTNLSAVEAKVKDTPPLFSVDRLEEESKRTPTGKSSGWKALDSQEVFFNPGELSIIGARTGHGKTSALVGLLMNWLRDTNGKELLVLYSAEEPEVRIYHRLLALLTVKGDEGWTVPEVRDYLRGGFSSRGGEYIWKSKDRLDAARDVLRRLEDGLLIVHRSAWTVEEIDAHARTLASRRNVGAVLVDYLQRIPAPAGGRYDRRDIEVSTVARCLKSLAVDLSLPVVAGCQINRESVPQGYREKLSKVKSYEAARETIKGARPLLSHLREGGAEQEADLVLGLLNYAADFQTDTEEESREVPEVTRLEVGTLKNRGGIPGRWTPLSFYGRSNFIRDPEEREVF